MSPWRIVCAKELRETLRDRRTLLMMVVVPVLLYPVLLIVMEQLLLFGMRNLEEEASPVALTGEIPVELVALVEADSTIRIVAIHGDVEEALRADSITAAVVVGPPAAPDGSLAVTVVHDATSDRSDQGRDRLIRVIGAWRDSLLLQRLEARGLARTFAQPLAVADSSIARPEEVGAYTMGRLLPLLLVVITLLGTFYPAIDLAAGEKERGTLETLLTAPVPPRAIVAGKFVTIALIGVIAASLNFGSMLLTFQTGVLQLTDTIGVGVSMPLRSVLVIFVALVPLAVLFGSLFLGIAVRSSSFKEAQNALTPVYMLVLVPAMLPIFPGIDFGPILAVTPVAGVSFLFRDLMTGDAELLLGALVLVWTTFYAVAALAFAARAFGSERVLFGDGDEDSSAALSDRHTDTASGPRAGAPSRLRAVTRLGPRTATVPGHRTALLFVAVVAVFFFWGGVRLQVRLGEQGLLVAQWLLLFVPAVVFVALRFDPVSTLSLAPPRPLHLVGGAVLIAGALPLVWVVGWLQTFVLPVPWELLEGLEELVRADSPTRLAWLLLLLAVTPAFCEEVVFRGILLSGTRAFAPWRMIALNAVVFGAFHLSFQTVIRFLPSAVLGAVIAFAVWKTASIWVGILMHFLNNATIVLLASLPALGERFADPQAGPPLWMVPVAGIAFVAGLRILHDTAPPKRGDLTTSTPDR